MAKREAARFSLLASTPHHTASMAYSLRFDSGRQKLGIIPSNPRQSRPMTSRKFALIALSILGMIAAGAGENFPLNRVHLPPGFESAFFAKVPNARSMTLSPNRLNVLFAAPVVKNVNQPVPACL
jgi:hypothetical protein